ncbi:hypothetical protein [Catellatospora tritici]|uniref:hypothetical protein n=1 Tax=Catellatospora tritici TaxID=2851566 RepID=UPI001C2DC6A3|nr:hypothetical protein [Catellatospora tritici]MBV1853672.1 hypothetical protein [Catellatospora tritici]
MPESVELILRFHPVGGEDITVLSHDFVSEQEAVNAIAASIDERRSLVLTQARFDRESQVAGVVINSANIVSARVGRTDSAASGQYL